MSVRTLKNSETLGSTPYAARYGANLGRVAAKLAAGQNIVATAIGDSILNGSTVTFSGGTQGVDDCFARLCSTLATRFTVTATPHNRAVSGMRASDPMITSWTNPTTFSAALADAADLYVISFGHNDLRSDSVSAANLPGTGYAKTASWRAVEHMVRRIRADVPFADIIIMTESPYSAATATTNPYLAAYNVGLEAIAGFYGCEFVDAYAAIVATGAIDTYIIDAAASGGNHPNTTGHHFMGDLLASHFPASATAVQPPAVVPALPPKTVYGAERYDRRGWLEVATQGRNNGANGYRVSGTWTNSGAGNAPPHTSTTANDFVELQFIGTECQALLDTGSGQGHVKIQIDGATYNADLNLGVFGTGTPSYLAFTLGWGMHRIVVSVVSGSVTFRGFDYVPTPALYIPYTSARLTFTGTWLTGGADAAFYQGNSKYTATTGDTLAFDFTGTGFALDAYRYSAAGPVVGLSLDGVAQTGVDIGSTAGTAGAGGIVVASGLGFGRKSVILTAPANAASRNLQIGGVFIFDETRLARPRRQRGLAIVGDAVTYPAPYAARPALHVVAADGTSTTAPSDTSPTATGFTVAGIASALVQWESEGDLVAY